MRHGVRHVAGANHDLRASAAPLGPAGLFARPSRQAREHATLDSRCRAGSSSPAFVAARNPRCNARSGRHAAEHGRRAPRGRHTDEHSRRALRHATLDAMHGVVATPPSTVGEHREGVIHDHVPANAPGRIEGRGEHHDRAVERGRDTRPGLCCVRGAKLRPRRRALTRHGQRRLAPSRQWQTRHAPRRPPRRSREPRSSRIGPLPSVLFG
jgi:hypothetical protein